MTQPRRKRSAPAPTKAGRGGSPRLLMSLRPLAPIPITPAVRTEQLRPPSYEYAPRAAGRMPVQNVVDRAKPPEPFLLDIKLFSQGKLVETLQVPEFGPSAPLPADPARFSSRIASRQAASASLAPVLAARLVARGRAR
jgi:hypothetical protein